MPREVNVNIKNDWQAVLLSVTDGYSNVPKRFFRRDAGFVKLKIYEWLDVEEVDDAFQLPANDVRYRAI